MNLILLYEKETGAIRTISGFDYIDLFLDTLVKDVHKEIEVTNDAGESMIVRVPLIVSNKGVLQALDPLPDTMDFLILTSGTKEEYANMTYEDYVVDKVLLDIQDIDVPLYQFVGVSKKTKLVQTESGEYAYFEAIRKNVIDDSYLDKIVENYVAADVEDLHSHLFNNFKVSNNSLVQIES